MLLSVAVTVKLKIPAAVGVPLSRPFELRARPPGNAPEVIANVKGAVPPLAEMVWLMAVATLPLVNDVGETKMVGAFTVRENVWALEAVVESVAIMLKLNVPPAGAVPLRTPAELSVRPAGSDPLVTAKV